MTKPLPPRLLELTEGYTVAGTHDVHTALQIIVEEHHDWIDEYRREEIPAELEREIAAEIGGRLNALLESARTGWSRQVPAMRGNCACGEEHAWDLFPAREGSPGAFRVVWWPI